MADQPPPSEPPPSPSKEQTTKTSTSSPNTGLLLSAAEPIERMRTATTTSNEEAAVASGEEEAAVEGAADEDKDSVSSEKAICGGVMKSSHSQESHGEEATGGGGSNFEVVEQNPGPQPLSPNPIHAITQTMSPSRSKGPPPDTQAPTVTVATITHPPESTDINDLLLIPLAELTVLDPTYQRMRDEIRRAGYSNTDPLTVIEFVESLLTSSNLWDELKNPFRTPHITPDLFTNVDSLVSSGFNENTGKKMKANPSHSAGGGDGGDDNGGGGGDDDDDEWDVDWNDEGEENDPPVEGDVADGTDLDRMEAIRKAVFRKKQAYIQVTTALKAVKFVLWMHKQLISNIKEHHDSLRKEAMTLQGIINARKTRGPQPKVSTPYCIASHICIHLKL